MLKTVLFVLLMVLYLVSHYCIWLSVNSQFNCCKRKNKAIYLTQKVSISACWWASCPSLVPKFLPHHHAEAEIAKLLMHLQSGSWTHLSPYEQGIQRSVYMQGQESRRWYEIKMRASLATTP